MNFLAVFGFNTSYVSVQANNAGERYDWWEFQYILCVGSSIILKGQAWEDAVFQYILCVGSRNADNLVRAGALEFQYILCVGSRELILLPGMQLSLVSIHPMCRFKLY